MNGPDKPLMAWRRIIPLIVALGFSIATPRCTVGSEPAISPYGQKNAQAPDQLGLFSFLVGKWQGVGKARTADGSYAHFAGVTWIGRYILNGMAIADEFHAATPDGKPYLGISFRQFDPQRQGWTIEYLNVSNSFLRRQVEPGSGSVTAQAGTVVVIAAQAQTRIREFYQVTDQEHFTYSTDLSKDGGNTWDPVSIEIALTRVE
jgi:Protein of unknown function (DUF1579)